MACLGLLLITVTDQIHQPWMKMDISKSVPRSAVGVVVLTPFYLRDLIAGGPRRLRRSGGACNIGNR
jgi:hypothetical protein